MLCCSIFATAQVKVWNNGMLSVGADFTDLPDPKYGVFAQVKDQSATPGPEYVAIYGYAHNISNSYSRRYIGVLGKAHSNLSSGTTNPALSFGVAGLAGLCNNSVGVYGGTNSLPSSIGTGGAIYAGYFAGNVKVTGALTAGTITQSSDRRLKKDIQPLNISSTVDKLRLLKPVQYNLEQREIEYDSINNKGIKVSYKANFYDEKSQDFQKKHYGLLAQDLQEVYPDLVYEGGDGHLEINYIGLIPLLLQAVQEQQIALEELQKQLLGSSAKSSINSESLSKTKESGLLFQNVPNPFSERTEIKYYLPETIQKAFLFIYDMNGKQIRQIPISQKGNASVVIAGSQLQAGIYLYSLVADNQVIDTKQMILTK